MLGKLSSAFSSLTTTPAPAPLPDHNAASRASTYTSLARELSSINVPVSVDDCAKCGEPCPVGAAGAGDSLEIGSIWNGKTYPEYVMHRYGDLGHLPEGFDTDWDTELAGSAQGGRGRIVVISTGKSDWERDHVDEKDSFAHQLNSHIQSLNLPVPPQPKPDKNRDFTKRPAPSAYIFPAALPPPSASQPGKVAYPPSLFSSSLISQSDDPEDQTVLVFPDWKVVHEVENSRDGAKALFSASLDAKAGPAGLAVADEQGTDRRRSWVLPYRAVILLCSHKRRDKRCHIAAPLLRSALHTVLEKHGISIDETGASLSHLDGPALEDLQGSAEDREAEVGRRIAAIEGVHGGQRGEVGIFNINHLGGHRYAGVMLILFPSGAYLSYGRVTPQEIPRVVEDTILQGKIVPGLLRNAVGVERALQGKGFLVW